ncbi:MAG: hypothetical protein ACLFTE_08145 [Salinivenus sp.]
MQLSGRQTQFYIDIIYGIGFAAGFGYMIFGDGLDPRVAAFEGGLVFGYILRVWENMSVYERILQEEVAAEAENAVAEEIEDTMPGEVEEAVAKEVEGAVAAQAEEAVPEEVTAEVERQVAEEITDEIKERVGEEMEEKLRDVGERVPEKVKEKRSEHGTSEEGTSSVSSSQNRGDGAAKPSKES